MKRFAAAIAIALSVAAIGTACALTTVNIVSEMSEKTKQLQESAATAEDLKLFEERWNQYEKLLSCYTRHNEIEKISESVEILSTVFGKDEELFRIECSRINTALEHLKRTELPYLSNIF